MRRIGLLTVILTLSLFAVVATGQEFLELETLHLIAWEDIPGGELTYAGPLSAAILMAWHAETGYPRLLEDLNGDGHIDEADTIELALEFAEPMGAHDGPVWDPRIVDVLAPYVADRYPDTFEMWVYDPSIPDEFRDHLGRSFDPADYPGIEILILEEPSHLAYVEHLEHHRPGIVGIGFESDPNEYAVSRSAVLDREPVGWPVDLANTSRMIFGPEPVWETILRERFEAWVFDLGDWIPFEAFIVLVPVRNAEGGPADTPGDDPGDPFDPGPGGDPGDDPFDPGQPGGDPGGDPGGGDRPRYPGEPGGEPGGDPFDPETPSACCLPDGSCQMLPTDACERLGGAVTLGADCSMVRCPGSTDDCSAVEGEITDICYTYENGILSVYASYEIHNKSPVDAHDITAYALVGLNDGFNGLGGGPECQYWQYGLDIKGNSTYSFSHVFSTSAPNLDLSNLTYLYGSLWLQKEAPWTCWGITKQAWVNTWDPAPRCGPSGSSGTPPGGREGEGEPGAEPPPGSSGDGAEGACCLPDGSCGRMSEDDCRSQDGLYYGPGTDCSSIRCFPAEPPPCPIVYSRVTDACQMYLGPDQPMIVKADFEIRNPGTEDAISVGVKVLAGTPLQPNLMTTYNDMYEFVIPVIPAGGSHSFSQTFTIDPAPPALTGQTAVMIFAAPITPLCKPSITSISQVFHLLTFTAGERLCPLIETDSPGETGGDVLGACCLPDGHCEILDATECDRIGGQFRGENTTCSEGACDEGEPEPGEDPEPEPEPEPGQEPGGEPGTEPGTGALPNLWVTDVSGSWSVNVQEDVIVTVGGIVHNGGQATASSVRASVSAGGESSSKFVGTILAGGQKQISDTVNIGSYESVSWPISISITVDPKNRIVEADETNNTTSSAIGQ